MTTTTGAPWNLRKPESTDPLASIDDQVRNLADDVDAALDIVGQKPAYVQITASAGGLSGSGDVAGLSLTVNTLAGHMYRISACVRIQHAASGNVAAVYIKEGATQLNEADGATNTTNPTNFMPVAIVTPAAGAHTYKVSWASSGSTITITASATGPNFLMVEDLGVV